MKPRKEQARRAGIAAVAALAVLVSIAVLPLLVLFLIFLLLIRPIKEASPEPIRSPVALGSIEVRPETVVAGGDARTIEIAYEVGGDGIREGGAIRLCPGKVLRFGAGRWRLCLQWANGWGDLQSKNRSKPNHVEVLSPRREVKLEISMMDYAVRRTQVRWLKRKFLQKLGRELESIDPRDAFIENQKVTVKVVEGELRPGEVVRFRLGREAGMQVPHQAMNTDFAIEIDNSGSGGFDLESEVPTLQAVGGEPKSFEVVAPSMVSPGEKFAVLVRCLDGRGVLTPELSGRQALVFSEDAEVPDSVTFPKGTEGVAWFQASCGEPGVTTITVRDKSGDLQGKSNPIACARGKHRLLWGDMHTHSVVSDGTQEPWYYYFRARNLMGWDFTAVTDHDIWSLAEEHPRTPEEFELMVGAANRAYLRTGLVTFPAYEWTDHRQGHRNILFGPDEEPVFLPTTDPVSSTPAKLFDSLGEKDALVIPHHPAWRTHRGEMHYDYGPVGNPFQLLAEVYSTHGNSEFYGCPRPITHVELMEGAKGKLVRAFLGQEFADPDSGSYVRDALAAGHRMGLVAGSDGHLVGVDPRESVGLCYGGGLTCVVAERPTREAVWDALRRRAVYATSGPRMIMGLRVNGRIQGSELACDAPPRITGHVIGTSELELVEVVKFDEGGYRPAWQGGGGTEAVLDFSDKGFSGDSFYYLRVVQSDGHLGWAGPIWVDRACH